MQKYYITLVDSVTMFNKRLDSTISLTCYGLATYKVCEFVIQYKTLSIVFLRQTNPKSVTKCSTCSLVRYP